MKTAVVTGASSGIGYHISAALQKDGYNVYGLCRRNQVPQKVFWKSCDVTRRDTVRQSIREITDECGHIDVFINNAGMGIAGAFEYCSEDEIRKQFEVNLFGSTWCTQEIMPVMRKQGGGRILYMSSLAGIFPIPFQSFYSASKSALDTLSDAVGLEGKPFGIETCSIQLNDVSTEFTDSRVTNSKGNDEYSGRILKSINTMELSERNGIKPEDIALAVVKLLNRKKLPPHKIVGASNECLGLLKRILPSKSIMALLYKIYGGL